MSSAGPVLQRFGPLEFQDDRGLGVSGRSSVEERPLVAEYASHHAILDQTEE